MRNLDDENKRIVDDTARIKFNEASHVRFSVNLELSLGQRSKKDHQRMQQNQQAPILFEN